MFQAFIKRKNAQPARPEEVALGSTVFSLTTLVPRPTDEKVDERLLGLLPIAKLMVEGVQDMCRIRSLTAGGLMAQTIRQHRTDQRAEVELSSDQRIAGTILWVRGTIIGIKFDEDVDLRELLARRNPRHGFVRRPPRLEINCAATVRIGKLFHKVEVNDISLGGIKVRLHDPDCVGATVIVTVESLRQIKGKIGWYKDGHAGVVFDRPLAFEELAEWLSKRLELASLKSGAWDKARR